MNVIGIALGIITFLLVGAIVGDGILHHTDAGAAPGLVAGIWAAWPFFHKAGVHRYNFLHPVPRRYKAPAKLAFVTIHNLLAEAAYNFGDRWRIVSAEPSTNRILADLRFTDEEQHMEADARGHLRTRTRRVQRYLQFEAHFKPVDGRQTIIQLDFSPRVEGVNSGACDSIIADIQQTVDLLLGAGVQADEPASAKLPAPPWWLLALTLLMLLDLFKDVQQAVFGH